MSVLHAIALAQARWREVAEAIETERIARRLPGSSRGALKLPDADPARPGVRSSGSTTLSGIATGAGSRSSTLVRLLHKVGSAVGLTAADIAVIAAGYGDVAPRTA